jgi:hypothetical protein
MECPNRNTGSQEGDRGVFGAAKWTPHYLRDRNDVQGKSAIGVLFHNLDGSIFDGYRPLSAASSVPIAIGVELLLRRLIGGQSMVRLKSIRGQTESETDSWSGSSNGIKRPDALHFFYSEIENPPLLRHCS